MKFIPEPMAIKDDPGVAAGMWLPVMEEFYSIQGEGYHTGKPAYFIRIGGCDNACHWCDTKSSWFEALFPLLSIDELCNRVLQHPARAVVITGGEPLIYNLNALSQKLRSHGLELFLETSGSDNLSGEWNWVCLSPKKGIPVKPELFNNANELKVVVLNETCFDFAESMAAQVPETTLLYLQPEWSLRKKSMPMVIEYVKKNPKWMISLQSHKYMEIP